MLALLALPFLVGPFLAAAFGGRHKRVMIPVVFFATVIALVGFLANDPAGATAGVLFATFLGAVPATIGTLAGLTIDRWRSRTPMSAPQVAILLLLLATFIVIVVFFPRAITPTIEF